MLAKPGITYSKQKRPSKIASRPQHSKRSSLSANRVALPAGTYCSIAQGLLQLRLAREQKQYSAQLQELRLTYSAVEQ
jgi:6-phosphogluconate dehydrogenase